MGMFGAQSVMLTGRCARAFGGRRLAAQESADLGVFGRGGVLFWCARCVSRGRAYCCNGRGKEGVHAENVAYMHPPFV